MISSRYILPFLCGLGLASSALAMPIFSEGEERAIVVVPDDSSQVTRYAADELVRYLNASTQGDFILKKESELTEDDGFGRIYVGNSKAALVAGIDTTQLEKNQYVVFPSKSALYLIGRDDVEAEAPFDDAAEMGSLLAVYDWIDRSLGVRWFWPGELGTDVPRLAKLETADGPPVYRKPSLGYSRMRFYATYSRDVAAANGAEPSLDALSHLRTNEWFRRHKIYRTAGERAFYGHAFGTFWDRFGKEHPEYFAQRPDGVRGPLDQRTNLTQLCVSNPELHKVIIAEWLRTRTEERPWVNACENDRRTIDLSCFCEACKAWDEPDAKVTVQRNPWMIESREPDRIHPYESVSTTDRYMRFLLELQKEARKHDPKTKVVGYAYAGYTDPPVREKLNEDIVIIVVPPYLYPLEKGNEAAARKLWDDWKATGATLIYRPNDFLVGHPAPYLYPRQFGKDFKHYLDNGMLWTKFDSFTGLWGTQGANLYMLGRLQSRPDLSPDEVLEEYYGAFGPARGAIRRYIEFWESVTARTTVAFQEEVKGGWNYMMVAPQRIFTPETYAEGRKILKEAMEAANGNKLAQRRVAYLQTWLDHSELGVNAVASYRKLNSQSSPEQRREFSEVLAKLRDFRAQHEAEMVGADWSFIKTVEPWTNWKE